MRNVADAPCGGPIEAKGITMGTKRIHLTTLFAAIAAGAVLIPAPTLLATPTPRGVCATTGPTTTCQAPGGAEWPVIARIPSDRAA